MKFIELIYKEVLPINFYLQNTETVAKQLLGKYLVKKEENGQFLIAMLTETEAYIPTNDQANHSANGKTNRNAAMFEDGGILYVYFIYGVHFCINVVTETAGKGCAVLLRAAEPMEGIELMKERRKTDNIKKLCCGPGNLAKAFGFERKHNFASLLSENIFIANNLELQNPEITSSTRVGISKSKDLLLRFKLTNSEYIS